MFYTVIHVHISVWISEVGYISNKYRYHRTRSKPSRTTNTTPRVNPLEALACLVASPPVAKFSADVSREPDPR